VLHKSHCFVAFNVSFLVQNYETVAPQLTPRRLVDGHCIENVFELLSWRRSAKTVVATYIHVGRVRHNIHVSKTSYFILFSVFRGFAGVWVYSVYTVGSCCCYDPYLLGTTYHTNSTNKTTHNYECTTNPKI
jgi:hypothetical protein